MSDFEARVLSEAHSCILLTNIFEAVRKKILPEQDARVFLRDLKDKDDGATPIFQHAWGPLKSAAASDPDRRLNQTACAGVAPGDLPEDLLISVQRAEHFNRFLNGVLDSGMQKFCKLIESDILAFDTGPKSDEDRLGIIASIQATLSQMEYSELMCGWPFVRLRSSISVFGGEDVASPIWLTEMMQECFAEHMSDGTADAFCTSADYIRDKLGLVHLGSEIDVDGAGGVTAASKTELLCVYGIRAQDIPEDKWLGRPHALHGDGLRFMQHWPVTADRVGLAPHGTTVDLDAFHNAGPQLDGAKEFVADRWDWPENGIEVWFTVLGFPRVPNEDYLTVRDDEFLTRQHRGLGWNEKAFVDELRRLSG